MLIHVGPIMSKDARKDENGWSIIVGVIEYFSHSFRSKADGKDSQSQFRLTVDGPFAGLFIKAVSLLISWNRSPLVDAQGDP